MAGTAQEELAQKRYNELKSERADIEKEIDRNDNNPYYDIVGAQKEIGGIQKQIDNIKKQFGYALKDKKSIDESNLEESFDGHYDPATVNTGLSTEMNPRDGILEKGCDLITSLVSLGREKDDDNLVQSAEAVATFEEGQSGKVLDNSTDYIGNAQIVTELPHIGEMHKQAPNMYGRVIEIKNAGNENGYSIYKVVYKKDEDKDNSRGVNEATFSYAIKDCDIKDKFEPRIGAKFAMPDKDKEVRKITNITPETVEFVVEKTGEKGVFSKDIFDKLKSVYSQKIIMLDDDQDVQETLEENEISNSVKDENYLGYRIEQEAGYYVVYDKYNVVLGKYKTIDEARKATREENWNITDSMHDSDTVNDIGEYSVGSKYRWEEKYGNAQITLQEICGDDTIKLSLDNSKLFVKIPREKFERMLRNGALNNIDTEVIAEYGAIKTERDRNSVKDAEGVFAFGWNKYDGEWDVVAGTEAVLKLDARYKNDWDNWAREWANKKGFRGYSIGKLESHDPENKLAQSIKSLVKLRDRKFSIKVGDRQFVVSAENRREAISKLRNRLK